MYDDSDLFSEQSLAGLTLPVLPEGDDDSRLS